MYVNYAMVEDFMKLKEMNISVAGHIVIAKYGKIYRGDKVSAFSSSISSPESARSRSSSITFLNMCRKRERAAAVTYRGSPQFLPEVSISFLDAMHKDHSLSEKDRLEFVSVE